MHARTHACTHARTHTQPFYCPLDFVQDYPGELAPEQHSPGLITYCAHVIDSMVSRCTVRYDLVSSNHKPLLISFDGLLNFGSPVCNSNKVIPVCDSIVSDWTACTNDHIHEYQREMNVALCNIDIPCILFGTPTLTKDLPWCTDLIDYYYSNIVNSINNACRKSIPNKRVGNYCSEYVVPGWNDYVNEKHNAAKSAFLHCKYLGKPCQGIEYECMRTSRAQFKLALRYCKQHKEMLRADRLANSLAEKDYKKFWKLSIMLITLRQLNMLILLMVALVTLTLLKGGMVTLMICIIT